MAKTTYVSIPPGSEDLYYRGLNVNDRLVFGRMVRKDTLISRKRIAGLTNRSLLPQIADLWSALSSAEQDAWSDAGHECNLNGWRLFVKDTSIRIKNEVSGVATPSLFHQAWVGQIRISAPASEIKIAQLHPHFYWVYHKVPQTKSMYEPVLVAEDFALPLKIGLNYKSNLVSTGSGSFAQLYADVWSSYQGLDKHTELTLDLDFFHDWQHVEATLNSVIGHIIGYNLYIEFYNLTGDLLFDNIEAEHSGQNWVRDQFCQNIDTTFTRAFYQIPKNWVAINLPVGAEYDSIYPND